MRAAAGIDWHVAPNRLNASFIAPHFPLVVPARFFDLYPLDRIDMPEIPPGHLENQHPVHQRMRSMFGAVDFPEEQVRRAELGPGQDVPVMESLASGRE